MRSRKKKRDLRRANTIGASDGQGQGNRLRNLRVEGPAGHILFAGVSTQGRDAYTALGVPNKILA